MEEIIFDGETHVLNENFGYIALKLDEDEKLSDYVNKELIKYANYLYENDKDKVMEFIMEKLCSQVFIGSTPEDYQLIFRPSYLIGVLAQFSTLCLKFKRAEIDNLEINNE